MELLALIEAMASPFGLAVAILFSFAYAFVWRILLGPRFLEFGYRPIWMGLLLMLLVVSLAAAWYALAEFNRSTRALKKWRSPSDFVSRSANFSGWTPHAA